jgi:hypothetical protein
MVYHKNYDEIWNVTSSLPILIRRTKYDIIIKLIINEFVDTQNWWKPDQAGPTNQTGFARRSDWVCSIASLAIGHHVV